MKSLLFFRSCIGIDAIFQWQAWDETLDVGRERMIAGKILRYVKKINEQQYCTVKIDVINCLLMTSIFTVQYYCWVSPASLTLRLRGFNNFEPFFVLFFFGRCFVWVYLLFVVYFIVIFIYLYILTLYWLFLLALLSCNIIVFIILITYVMIKVMFIFYLLELLLWLKVILLLILNYTIYYKSTFYTTNKYYNFIIL